MASRSSEKQMNVRRAVERIKAMLNGSAFPLALIVPPYNEAEIDQAKFEVSKVSQSLRAPHEGEDATAGARRRALLIVFLYQMLLSEILGWFKQQKEDAIARAEAAAQARDLGRPMADESSELPEGAVEELSKENSNEKEN